MKTISSDVETNKYHVLGVKQKNIINALKQLSIPHFF